jgi:hypothetical protein
MSCGCGEATTGCGCGGRGRPRVLTEIVTAGLDTDYKGMYDPRKSYRYGDMVLASDGKTYVFLCNDTSSTNSIDTKSPLAGIPTTSNGSGSQTASTQSQSPTGTSPTGTSPTAAAGSWTLEGTPAISINPQTTEFTASMHASPNRHFELLFEPFSTAPEGNKQMLNIAPDAAAILSMSHPVGYEYIVDRSTAHIWYYRNNDRTWHDLGGVVGLTSSDIYMMRFPGFSPPARATMVVDRISDLYSLNTPSGTVVLVYRDWQVWQKS